MRVQLPEGVTGFQLPPATSRHRWFDLTLAHRSRPEAPFTQHCRHPKRIYPICTWLVAAHAPQVMEDRLCEYLAVIGALHRHLFLFCDAYIHIQPLWPPRLKLRQHVPRGVDSVPVVGVSMPL